MKTFHFVILAVATLALSLSAVHAQGPKSFNQTRTWTDSTGKYKVEGELQSATATEVQLTQTGGKVVKIPFDKLSAADQAFVQSYLKATSEMNDPKNPFKSANSGPFKPVSPSELASGGGDFPMVQPVVKNVKQIVAKLDKHVWNVTPPIGFPDVQFDEFAVATDVAKPFFAKFRVLSAGKSGVCVLSTYEQGRDNYSRFAVVFGSDETVTEVLERSEPWKLMAISPDGTRIAAVRVEGFDKGNDVGLFSVTKDGVVPEFQFKGGGGAWDELHFVGFAAGNRLVTISQKQTLTVWDLANSVPKAVFQGNSGGAMRAELSPAGELMALPAGNAIAIIDIASAKIVGVIPRDNNATEISFAQDATKFAAYRPFEVTLYSMADGKEMRRLAVSEHEEHPRFHWLGKYLLVGSTVWDVDRGLPLWTYEANPTSTSTVGGYLVCGFGDEKNSKLTINKIPHEGAIEAAKSVDPETIYAIRPGDPIAVDYQLGNAAGNVKDEIRKMVEDKIRKQGWVLSNSTTNRMLIELQQGKPETAEYYSRPGFGPPIPFPRFGGPPPGPMEKVNYTPWTHKITISADGQQLFHSSLYRGAPDGLQTKDGESTQAAVDRYATPYPAYFQTVPMPPHLLKAEYKDGMGKSKLDLTGLH